MSSRRVSGSLQSRASEALRCGQIMANRGQVSGSSIGSSSSGRAPARIRWTTCRASPLLLLGQLGADHRLHQPVHLDAVADLVDLGEGEPADLPDDPAEHQLLLERGVVRLAAPSIISLL